MPPLQSLLGLFLMEAGVLLFAAWCSRREPLAVARAHVSCPKVARRATIYVAAPLEPGLPPTLIRCSLLERGRVDRCDRACLLGSQGLRRPPYPTQTVPVSAANQAVRTHPC